MAVQNKGKREVVLIDADWLLGAASIPTKRSGSRFFWIVLSLSMFGGVVWSWPLLSKRWLEWDWTQRLASDDGAPEEVLPILIALNDMSPNNLGPIVQQLASENAERRLVAFHLLQHRIDRWTQHSPTRSEIESMLTALQAMPSQVPESILMRGQLAARLTLLVDDQQPNSSILRSAIENMASAAKRIPFPTVPSVDMAPSKSTSTGRVSEPVPVPTIDSPEIASTAHPAKGTMQTVARIAPEASDSIINNRSSAPISYVSSPSVKLPPPKISLHLSKDATSELLPSPPAQLVSPVKRIVIADSIVRDDAEPDRMLDSHATSEIAGVERLPLEDLLNVLASTQRRLVQEASKELLRRGLANDQLELCLEIAQGDGEKRLRVMEELKNMSESVAIPMLAWLAEQSEAKVRRKAISLLGAFSNPDSVRSLRMLKLREPDGPIADQINQVLLAVGTNANLRR